MTIKQRIINLIINRPFLSLLLGLGVFFGCAFGAKTLAPDFSYRVWFNEGDPLIVEFDTFERRFGNDDRAVVIIHSPSGIFDKDSAQLLIEMTEKAWQLPYSMRVDSLANFNWVHADGDELLIEPIFPDDVELTDRFLSARRKVVLAHETLPNYMISKDGTAALMYITIKPTFGGSPDYEGFLVGVDNADGSRRKGLRDLAREMTRGDHKIMITGGPAINHSFKEAAEADISTIFPVVFGLTLLFLLIMFRRPSGVLFPIVVIGTSVAAAMGIGGWLGYSINNMTSIVPQILVAIAVADAVHILVSYFRAIKKGANRKVSARYSLEKNYVPTLLTSVSTAIGFFSFSQAAVVPIGQLGTMAGLGTLLAWYFTYFVLGPLLVLVPIKAGDADQTTVDLQSITPFALQQTDRLLGVRRVILGIFALIAVGTVYLASQTKVNSDPFEYFRDDSDMNIATKFLEEKVGGATTVELVVDSGKSEGFKDPEFLRKVEAFQNWLEEEPYVTSNNSLVDILKAMNRSLHAEKQSFYKLPESRNAIAQQFELYRMSLPQGMDVNDRVSVKNDAIRITSAWNIHDSATVLAKIDLIEEKLSSMGLAGHVTGKFQLWQRMNPYVVKTFVTSISIAVVLMSILMIVVFRSFKLGLLAMLPNVFPLLLGAALIKSIGHDLDMGTVLSFSFCLGIAVDDTVHFMSDYARLTREGRTPREAIAGIFTHTVPALMITTIVLVVGFGAFMFAIFLPNQAFGLFVAVILSLALLTDLTLLPALLMRGESPAPAKHSVS
ncbi:MAG: MMPL family transporter [Myxococcota bacterium]|nr:MMPL family transporter [Myxococcota bacterium]